MAIGMISSVGLPRTSSSIINYIYNMYMGVITLGAPDPQAEYVQNDPYLYQIHSVITNAPGKPYSMHIRYNDDISTQTLFKSSGSLPESGRYHNYMRALDLDFSMSNVRSVTVELTTLGKDGVTTLSETITHKLWKPEITVDPVTAYRCTEDGMIDEDGQYIMIEGHIAFGLVNSDVLPGIYSGFLPMGRYRFGITDDAENSETIYTDYAYATNSGSYASYQNAKNGFDFSEIVNCSGMNPDNISFFVDTSVIISLEDDRVIYSGDKIKLALDREDYLHFSPRNMGMGIGGPPIHGNYEDRALDIHWPIYAKKLELNSVDMTLDDETIALWSEILGGMVTLKGLLLNISHPVGSIIQTTRNEDEFNPNTMLGGTWRLLPGVMLFGATTGYALTSALKDGGSADASVVSHTHAQVAHTHSVGGQSANHTHSISGGSHSHGAYYYDNRAAIGTARDTPGTSSTNSGTRATTSKAHTHTCGGASAGHTHSVTGGATTTGATGVSGAGKNMPPYKVVNIWERTA